MAFNTERTGPPKPGLRVEDQQAGGVELLSPEEQAALDAASKATAKLAIEDWNDTVAERFLLKGKTCLQKKMSIPRTKPKKPTQHYNVTSKKPGIILIKMWIQ